MYHAILYYVLSQNLINNIIASGDIEFFWTIN